MFSQVCVSHSVHRGRGSLSWGLCLSKGSLSIQGVSVRETPPDRDTHTVKSGRYASYWNAFLFILE